jgi:hypothetical protein
VRIVYLGGEPATGKTSIARRLIQKLEMIEGDENIRVNFKFLKVRGQYFKQIFVWVLGVYEEGQTFAGTDKLSMAVLPDAIQFFKTAQDCDRIFIEGDRLAVPKFFIEAQKYDAKLFYLSSPEAELDIRHVARGDKQSSSFLKSRKTKWKNLRANFEFTELRNERPEHVEACARKLLEALLAPN